MAELTQMSLNTLANIVTGRTPRQNESDSWGDQIDFITPSDQRDGVRFPSVERRLSRLGGERLRRSLLPQYSTNLTCIGSTIGKVSMSPSEAITNQQINSLVAKPEVMDPVFLYYMILNWSPNLRAYASGSATPIVNKTTLANFRFWVPSLGVQQATAEVLGALDDKIAANTKLAKTADEVAVTEFTRVARNAEFSAATFGDVARVSGGGTPSTKVSEFWGGDVPWATPTDITALAGPYLESTSRTLTKQGLKACSSALFPSGAIFMTSRATIGAFAIAQFPTAVNQGFIVVEPYDTSLEYWIFHDMRSRVDEFISMANGATFLELSRGNFRKLHIRVASEELMRSFGVQAEELHNVGRHALRENLWLAKLRDTLLPELMSGRLRVKDAELIVDEVI